MSSLRTMLRVLAPVFLLVACLHIALGLGADVLLGARVTPEVLVDPGLDSQNRFYGASMILYAGVLWVGSSDVARYATVLRLAFGATFFAGLTRILSMALRGLPPTPVLGLFALEIVLPPLLWIWLARASREQRA